MAYTNPDLPPEINSKIIGYMPDNDLRNLTVASKRPQGIFGRLQNKNLLEKNLLAMMKKPHTDAPVFAIEKENAYVSYEFANAQQTATLNVQCTENSPVMGIAAAACFYTNGTCTAVTVTDAQSKTDITITAHSEELMIDGRKDGITVETENEDGDTMEMWEYTNDQEKEAAQKFVQLCPPQHQPHGTSIDSIAQHFTIHIAAHIIAHICTHDNRHCYDNIRGPALRRLVR